MLAGRVRWGFGSQSYADVVRDRVAHEQREARLLVVSGFDCSGEDIERDWVERTACWSSVTRVLLTYDQVVHDYELPATEGKRGDPRWPAFARRYGFDTEHPVQWEVEALEPDELRRLVLAAVDPYSQSRPPGRRSNAAPWPPSWTAGTRRAGERDCSAVRVPAGSGRCGRWCRAQRRERRAPALLHRAQLLPVDLGVNADDRVVDGRPARE
ncbi:hypothetical protein [Streptomyces olivaceus]|uniref:hypothetical protein n=1 Tax=Streptomyces olivaceus TaxID=47716 RepID=UPI001CCE5127|nr:hypothetical protein [Streptomyces olivaceus]